MEYNEEFITKILDEVRREQAISPKIQNATLENYIKEGIYDINNACGTVIDYSSDLKARVLLKNYVMYANFKRLAEFKELYVVDYAELQAYYYESACLQ